MVEDPVLHLVQPEMVLIEHAPGVFHVEHVVGAFGPRQRQHPVDVVPAHGRFRRHRGRPAQLPQFTLGPNPGRLGEPLRRDLLRQPIEVVAVFLPQLAVDRLELLLQVELALVAIERPAHVVVDLALQTEQVRLGGDQLLERLEQVDQRGRLEQPLPHLVPHREVSGDRARHPLFRGRGLGQRRHLGGDPALQADVLLEPGQRLPRPCPVFRRQRPNLERGRDHAGADMTAARHESRYADATQGLDQDARPAAWRPAHLLQSHHHADPIEVAGRRLGDIRVPLRDEDHPPLRGRGRGIDRGEGPRPPDQQRHEHVGKHDHVAQRHDGEAVRNVVGLGVASEEHQRGRATP